MNLYDLLSNVLTSVVPRNERARAWLDRIIVRSHALAKSQPNPIALRAIVEEMRHDFDLVLVIQGQDPKQREFYDQIQHLLNQIEQSTRLNIP